MFRPLTILMIFMLVAPLSSRAWEDGFTSLFNGENLDGWVVENGAPDSFVVDQQGNLHVRGVSGSPCWLRSEKEYENFDLRFRFMVKGWSNGGLYFHAPLHGRLTSVGYQFQIYHSRAQRLTDYKTGAIFESIPPKINAIYPANNWNDVRILMEWPSLRIWVNHQLVQDLNVDEHPDLRYRLRRGYLGILDAHNQVWFRDIRIKELPAQEEWIALFNGENLDGWYEEGSGATWTVQNGVIHARDDGGYLVTEGEWEDFDLFLYFRSAPNANGGVFFRWKELATRDRGYEIQVENVPDSPHPTGSLYNIVRARQPHFQDGEWMPMLIRVKGSSVAVRANGETTVEYDGLEIIRPGKISLQMHFHGKWIEYKGLRIKPL